MEYTLNTIAFGLSTGKVGACSHSTALWATTADLLMADQETGVTSNSPASTDLAELATLYLHAEL